MFLLQFKTVGEKTTFLFQMKETLNLSMEEGFLRVFGKKAYMKISVHH